MKKRIGSVCLLTICAVLSALAVPAAYADMGPHPAVTINLLNLDNHPIYVTLLSEKWSTGPYVAYDETDEYGTVFKCANVVDADGHWNFYEQNDTSTDEFTPHIQDVWQLFSDYADSDDYYFLQIWWEFTGNNSTLDWGYMAPRNYKLLLYFPEQDEFVCSDVIKSYALHSYYTVDLAQAVLQVQSDPSSIEDITLEPSNSYDYLGEVLGILFRIAATILVELCLALVMRLRKPIYVDTIIWVNLVTQTLLNVVLNLFVYFGASILYIFLIVPMELTVFAVEAIAYSLIWRKQTPIWRSFLYALAANALSFALGILLAAICPFLF